MVFILNTNYPISAPVRARGGMEVWRRKTNSLCRVHWYLRYVKAKFSSSSVITCCPCSTMNS